MRRRRDVFAVISMERMLYKKGGKEQTAGHRYNALARDKREDVHRKTKYSSLHRERAILHPIPLHFPSSSILHSHQSIHTSVTQSTVHSPQSTVHNTHSTHPSSPFSQISYSALKRFHNPFFLSLSLSLPSLSLPSPPAASPPPSSLFLGEA